MSFVLAKANGRVRLIGAAAGGVTIIILVVRVVQRHREQRKKTDAAAATVAKRRPVIEAAKRQLRAMDGRAESLEMNDMDEAVGVMVRAFCGTATTLPELGLEWMLGEHVRPWNHPLRIELFQWGMRGHWFESGPGSEGAGLAIGVPMSPGAQIGAVCILTPRFDADGKVSRALPYNRGPSPLLKPEYAYILNDSKRMLRREFFHSMVDRMHEAFAPGPHWYVHIMAVDPRAHGQGLCSIAMRAANAIADTTGMPLYLEADGVKNQKVYSRFGYSSCFGLELAIPEDPESGRDPELDGGTGTLRLHAMLRPAASLASVA